MASFCLGLSPRRLIPSVPVFHSRAAGHYQLIHARRVHLPPRRPYADSATGEVRSKYLVILSLPPGDDVVFRVLTSRHANLRPSGCFHGVPYPGFALGVLGGQLTKPTWVDLREQDDYDADVFRGRLAKGAIAPVMQLGPPVIRELMACATGAADTTRRQARHIQDQMASAAT